MMESWEPEEGEIPVDVRAVGTGINSGEITVEVEPSYYGGVAGEEVRLPRYNEKFDSSQTEKGRMAESMDSDNEDVAESPVPYDTMEEMDEELQTVRQSRKSTSIEGFKSTLSPDAGAAGVTKLGTWDGVMIPVTLGIFGVITFLRSAWVVGQAGYMLTLVIVTMGLCCVVLTTLSLSAIASNGTLRGGGAYYMISRSLGPEFGGSIGVIFYLANIFGCGVYLNGIVEATGETFGPYGLPTTYWWNFLYATVVLMLLTGVSMGGAGLFAKAMFGIFAVEMMALFSALLSFMVMPAGEPGSDKEGFTSWSSDTWRRNQDPHFQPVDGQEQDFQTVFAVFFPAMAGIMAGANMSGDLKEPAKNIAQGTLAAIGGTFAYYYALMTVVAATTLYTVSAVDYYIMSKVVFWSPIILIGIYCAALSSALSAITGGARILQALARDNLIPALRVFGKGFGPADEPLVAVGITYLLIQLAILIPLLNTLATISSLFFLFSYGIVNFACFGLSITGAPNWRPSFKYFSWHTSLVGFLICIAASFVVHAVLASLSIVLLGLLFGYIHYTVPEQMWGDITQGIMFHQVRKFLLRLEPREQHLKNWRPSILLLVANPYSDRLISFVNSLKRGGLFIVGQVVTGEFHDSAENALRCKDLWLEFLAALGVRAFSEVIVSPSVRTGVHSLVMTSGLGAMKVNTVVLGFYDPQRQQSLSDEVSAEAQDVVDQFGLCDMEDGHFDLHEYVQLLRDIVKLEKNTIVSRRMDDLDKANIVRFALGGGNIVEQRVRYLREGRRMTLDVWVHIPSPNETITSASVTFTLLMGWLVSRGDLWKAYSQMRIMSFAGNADQAVKVAELIKSLCKYCRIPGKIKVVSLEESNLHSLAEDGEQEPFLLNLTLRKRCHVLNELIRLHSSEAAMVCLPLPPPPPLRRDGTDNSTQRANLNYMQALEILTDDLPPTLLMRGERSVIFTEL